MEKRSMGWFEVRGRDGSGGRVGKGEGEDGDWTGVEKV